MKITKNHCYYIGGIQIREDALTFIFIIILFLLHFVGLRQSLLSLADLVFTILSRLALHILLSLSLEYL